MFSNVFILKWTNGYIFPKFKIRNFRYKEKSEVYSIIFDKDKNAGYFEKNKIQLRFVLIKEKIFLFTRNKKECMSFIKMVEIMMDGDSNKLEILNYNFETICLGYPLKDVVDYSFEENTITYYLVYKEVEIEINLSANGLWSFTMNPDCFLISKLIYEISNFAFID